MGIPILDTILMQRVAGQCGWVPRLSLFIPVMASMFFIPVVQWFALATMFLCMFRLVIRNAALSRQVFKAAEISGRTYRYFNESVLGSAEARAAVAEALTKQMTIGLDAAGRSPALRFVPLSPAAREAAALACAMVYYCGDCDEEPRRDLSSITLRLKNADAHHPARRALYDRMLSEVLGLEVHIFSRAGERTSINEAISPSMQTTEAVTEASEHRGAAAEPEPSTVLQLDIGLWLEIERNERGLALRSCTSEHCSETVVYASAQELLDTWGSLLDQNQQDVVIDLSRNS